MKSALTPPNAAAPAQPVPPELDAGEPMRMLWESPLALTLQDLDFRLVAVNRAYADLTGYPESMLLGLDPLSLQPEEDRAAELALRRQVRLDTEAGRALSPAERRLVDAAGGQHWLRATHRWLRDARGRTLLLSMLHDATDEHQALSLAERSLREIEQWLDASPVGMVLIDAAGLLVRSNAAFEALVGAAPVALGDAPPELCRLLGWADGRPRDELRPGAPPLVNEVLLPLADGGLRRLRATLRCVEAPPQRHVLAVVEDRSVEDERDLARLQLRALVDAAGVGLATFHPSLGWLRAEGGGARSTPAGATTLQAIGRDIVEPASLADYERLQQALRDGERAEVRYAVRHPDIGPRWLLTRVEPGALASGQPTTSVVTLDVTDQQLARSRSDELLRELTTILESTTAGIAYLRGDRMVRCNRRFQRMLGLDGQTLAMSPLAALAAAHPLAAELIDIALRALHDAPLFETEFEVPPAQPGGTVQWYSLSARRSAGSGDDLEATAVLADITRLKVQSAQMEALARDHELMFELSAIGIGFLRAGRFERANEALAQLTGHAADALTGLDHAALFEDRAEYLRIAAQQRVALAGSGQWSGERRLRRADGSLIWVQAHKRLVRAGEVGGGIIASYVNVDDRRRAEESLLLQSERTRAILDSVLIGIVTVGENGIQWMNRSARRMFGGELADFIDQPIAVVATDEPDHPLRQTGLLDTLDEGEAHTFECRLRGRDGRVFWVAGNAVLTGRDTLARQLTFALLDIDRRREAEAKSAQTQASLRRIIEMAPLAIALRDARTLRVLQVNTLLAHAAGRPETELVGCTLEQLYGDKDAALLRADMQTALAGGEVALRREYRWTGADGVPRVWDARHLPLATRDGEPPDQLLTVATDVTEQRAAEVARLEAAIAQRELLVRELHHRIKNNLQGVAGLLQQAAQRRPDVAPVIAEAIGQVQTIAQVYGLQVGMAGPLRVKSVIESIVGGAERLHGRRIALGVDGVPAHRWALPEVESIPVALAVNELLNNAIRHAASDGEIGCTLVFSDTEVRIGIANPGALPDGFDLASLRSGVSGLGLVRALLPRRGASLSIANRGGTVLALVVLGPPAVAWLDAL